MAMTQTATKTNCGQPGTCETHTPCCPDCGAVECLCRPRFFAGQLLSEQDLNRLDQYIKNKNRLHNRNQHGWGVVNGLKVLCDPCGEVKVTEGYAVDPCGDDIVVCESTSVNICDLIRQCKQPGDKPKCEPFHRPSNSQCDDLEEEWVLTIQYQEWMSRGVTALRGNTCSTGSCQLQGCQTSSQGACGGGCSGGNGNCQPTTMKTTTTGKGNRGAPPECEPTVICEGFSFGVYPKPEEDPNNDDDDRLFELGGSFADAFNCCAEALITTIPPMPDLGDNDDIENVAQQYSNWCCRFRKNLIDYFTSHPNTSCEIIDFLNKINCPNINDRESYAQDFIASFLSLIAAWLEGVKICICLSLLPPTPPATCDTRVPLATVRVRSRDCKVLSICNWTTERKIMVTWPAMGHWLGIFSIGEFFHGLLDTVCCNSLLDIFDGILDNFIDDDDQLGEAIPPDEETGLSSTLSAVSASENEGSINESFSFSNILSMASADLSSQLSFNSISRGSTNFSNIVEGFAARGNQPLEIGALLNNVSPKFKLPTNGQALTTTEARNIPLVMVAEIVAKPVMNNILGEKETERQLKTTLNTLRGREVKPPRTNVESVQPQEMLKQLDEMQLTIDRQNQQIETFKRQLQDNS